MVAYGDVEHFRPKSKYWWLAYCYENYLYSCQMCNQRYKKAEFPIFGPELEFIISGNIAKNAPDSVAVHTPSATIGIRGTKFVVELIAE